jgi:CDP-paratose 2-epimerase
MVNVLITGGAGFIGSNLAARCFKKGNNVTILDNFSRAGSKFNLEWLKNNFSDINILKGDILNKEDIDKALSDDTDLVFHLAGQVAVTTSVLNPTEDFEINSLGTLNVLEAIRKCNNSPVFVYSSTNKVYGGMEGTKIKETESRYQYQDLPEGVDEEFPLDFHSPYGCSKGSADQYTRDYARIYGLKTIVFRQSCIYGYHQFGVEDQGWLAWFVIQSVLNRPITIFGDGKQVRDVLFVEDLCDSYEKAYENIKKTKGQIYNIGGGSKNQISLLESLELIKKCCTIEPKISFQEARPGDQKIFVSDISKAKKDFGWEPKTEIEDGIKKLSDWVKENKTLFK